MDDLAAQVLDALATAEVRRVEKPWGYEVIVDTGQFLLKYIYVGESEQTSLQYHDRKDEVIIPVGGAHPTRQENENAGHIYYKGMKHFIGDGPLHVHPGDLHRSVGPIELLEVTTMDNEDVVRVADSYGREVTL